MHTATIEELIAKLSHPEIRERVVGVSGLASRGRDALPAITASLLDARVSEIGKVWATIAIAQLGDDEAKTASRALTESLGSASAVVRWSALHALGGLRASNVISEIAKHLTDHAEVESAWFEDDCIVSHAAAAALRLIGTEEALRALAERGKGAA